MLTDDEIRNTMMDFQQQMMSAQHAKDSSSAITNVKEGNDFLDSNKSKDGVKTTSSGLQYKVEKEGTGPHPSRTSVVTVHYRGTLLNGDEFDSSYSRGKPASLELGSKYQFWIPSALAYGEGGSPPKIGPNATLMFEVELLSFK